MADALLWFSLVTSITSLCLAAACVVVCSRMVSRAIRVLNRKPPSESTLAKLVSDQTALFSSFESMATTVKRLSSRAGMQGLRSSRAANEAPPVGAPKAEVRKFYGLNTAGPEFARRQMSLVKE